MGNKKRITILVLHLQHGGIERQTILFANELVKKYDVEIISTYSMRAKPAYEVDKKIKIKYLIDDAPNRQEFKNAVKKLNIIKILKEGFKAFKLLRLKKKLMINQVKNLDCDFVLSTRIEFAEMLSKYAPTNVVKMTQEHLHDDSNKYIERVKKSFRNLEYLVVLGPGSKENYSKWLEDNEKIKIVEIPNILEKKLNESSELKGHTLISVGRLHPVKGFSDLLKVFSLVKKEIKDAKLNIVGGGTEFENLKKEAEELGIINDVNMPGMVSGDEVNKLMIKSDIYVMTSLTECFPMVLLEASACGLPLISFDVPVGPKAIIKNKKNGYLISDRNIEKMANIIIKLFQNKDEMKNMGKQAKKEVEQYLPENVMKKWDDIFEK